MNLCAEGWHKIYPHFINLIGDDQFKFINIIPASVMSEKGKRLLPCGDGETILNNGIPCAWCIIDGELRGYGLHVFFKSKEDLLTFKLMI